MSADREMLEILQRRHAPPLGDPLAAGRQGAAEAAAEVSSWLDLAKLIGPITWDWPKWLAPGFLHLLAARTGLGKSTLALRIAACYLAGWTWPDGNAFEGAHAAVLWIESEGAQALNLERAGKWGLPLGRILSPWPDPLADANILNARHRRAIEAAAHVPEVRLIVLDSLSGARASADENDSRALQSMKWLGTLARDTAKPVLATHHLRKHSVLDSTDEINLERLRGSSAITQVARLVWALDTPDAEREAELRLRVLKSNLARFPAPLGMTIGEDGRVSFGAAPEPPEKVSKVERAAKFLRSILRHGPVRATEVLAQGETLGMSRKTLRRAKDELCIEARQAEGCWWWRLDDEQIPE